MVWVDVEEGFEELWSPREGEFIEGTITGLKTYEVYFKDDNITKKINCYILKDSLGKMYRLPNNKIIMNRLSKIQNGNFVKIIYLGNISGLKGNVYKDYDVKRWIGDGEFDYPNKEFEEKYIKQVEEMSNTLNELDKKE